MLSDNNLRISTGTVGNVRYQFNKKSQNTLEHIKQTILKQPVINEDETPISVNGKIMSAIGVFTDKVSLVDAFENRSLESFKKIGILDRYVGTVCHDHNNIHLSFSQSKQVECNFHIFRYCKAEYEIHKRSKITYFINYLLKFRNEVDKYKLEGKTCFTNEEYAVAKEKYLHFAYYRSPHFN